MPRAERPLPSDARAQLPIRASLALLLLLLVAAAMSWDLIAQFMLRSQDIWLLEIALVGGALALLPSRRMPRPLSLDARALALIVVGVAVLALAGHYLLLSAYDFTRDEQMANFDATVFRAGRLAWPLPPAWQAHAAALNQRFMLPTDHPVAWISAYLPMNALIRAVLGPLTGPLLTALSVPLLWACARRLWPQQRETAVVCVLLLVSSGQFLFAGMTAYAMPGHLFCNLLWLWLFLRDRRASDLAALPVGFVATGLHQPLLHPMFVAPFLLLLLMERRWTRLAIFVPGYAVIGLFWLWWPSYMHAIVAGPLGGGAASGAGYGARLAEMLALNHDNLTTMAHDLLRFFTWQNLLLLPLMLASWPAVRRDRFAGALALGLLVPTVVMAIVLPSQGHGFGYRYFHGVLGNAVLLAGYGWNVLVPMAPMLRTTMRRALAIGLAVLLPVQAWMTHRLYTPFAEANARIEASAIDYVVIRDDDSMLMGHDLVLNRPDLSNRPIRLIDGKIADPQALAHAICRPGVRVGIAGRRFYRSLTAPVHMRDAIPDDARVATETTAFRAHGCSVGTLD